MNILDSFGGLQRFVWILAGVLCILIGVAFIIASNKGVRTVAGIAGSVVPAARPAAAVAAVGGAVSDTVGGE